MESRERKLIAAVLLACSVSLLIMIGCGLFSDCTDSHAAEDDTGQTIVTMSTGTLKLKGGECDYSIIVDTDTARRYLVVESEDGVRITNLEQPVPEM